MAQPPRLADAAGDLARRRTARRSDRPAAASTTPRPALTPPVTGPAEDSTQRVPVNSIARHPQNPRGVVELDAADIADLAASVTEMGVLEPLIVASRAAFTAAHPADADLPAAVQWVLIAGERRWTAARLAGLPTVPVVVRDNLTDDGLDVEAMIVENVQREDLTPLQEARAYRLLTEHGSSQRVIAKRVGRAQSHVAKRLALLKLPPGAQTAIDTGQLGVKDAEVLGTSVAAAEISDVWAAATRYGLTPGAVRSAISRHQADKDRQAAGAKAEKNARRRAGELDVAVIEATALAVPASRAALSETDDTAAIEQARAAGALAAVIDDRTGALVLVDTRTTLTAAQKRQAAESERTQQKQAANERLRRAAAKQRRALLPALIAAKTPPAQLLDQLATTVLHAARTDELRLARTLLPRLGDSAESSDHYAWRDNALNGPPAPRLAAARALALARAELAVASQWGGWNAEKDAYIDRLTRDAGYTPTDSESRHRTNYDPTQANEHPDAGDDTEAEEL